MYVVRAEGSSATDQSAFQINYDRISSSQLLNIEIINALWQLLNDTWSIIENTSDDIIAPINGPLQVMY